MNTDTIATAGVLSPEALENAKAQAEADAALMAELQERLSKLPSKPEIRIPQNRAERRLARRRPDRTAVIRPLDAKGKRRIQREARALAGLRS